MSRPEWIFFDCFNTLLDEADRLAGEHGMAPIAHLPVAAGLYENPDKFMADYVAWRKTAWQGDDFTELGLDVRLEYVLGKDQAALVNAMVAEFEASYPATVGLSPGIDDVLGQLHTRCRMGVVSNFFLPGLPARLLEQYGLAGYFDFVLDSAEFGIKKPGAEIYAEALTLADTSPGTVLFVGDSLKNDVLKPAALGMRSLWYRRDFANPPADAASAVVSFSHWDQFPSLVLGDE